MIWTTRVNGDGRTAGAFNASLTDPIPVSGVKQALICLWYSQVDREVNDE